MRKMLAIGRKELRQMVRDRRSLFVILFVPLFFLWLYGYALNFDIRHVPLAVRDDDHTRESRDVISAFLNSGYFELTESIVDYRSATQILDRGDARAVLVIPHGLGTKVRRGERADVQMLLNGDNANTASTVIGYAAATVRGVSATLQMSGGVAQAAAPLVSLETRVWYNPQLESTLFLVPGLIAYIAMITAVVSTSLSIVREKERGTMEQIRMSPVSTFSYVVGKSLPYFLLSFVSSMGILLAGMLMFGVPMRGEWWLLIVATSLFLMAALGMGLLVSTLADSQQMAFQIGLLMSFLPTFILSGFIFPIASMPKVVQLVTFTVPARYYLVALRGIVLKGVGFSTVAPQLAALTVFVLGVLGLASLRLSRERR
ncbi:MAG: ABC transporter permease [Vicinamibacterales bacterium]